MKAQFQIQGVFVVTKFDTSPEYGVQASVSEVGEAYPNNYMLALPGGTKWEKGDTFRLSCACTCMHIKTKAGGTLVKYVVSDFKLQPVTVSIVDVKESRDK